MLKTKCVYGLFFLQIAPVLGKVDLRQTVFLLYPRAKRCFLPLSRLLSEAARQCCPGKQSHLAVVQKLLLTYQRKTGGRVKRDDVGLQFLGGIERKLPFIV